MYARKVFYVRMCQPCGVSTYLRLLTSDIFAENRVQLSVCVRAADVDVKRAVSKEEMELVKGADAATAQHLAGLPPGLALGGAQGVLGGLGAGLVSPNLFSRPGQGVGAWPGMDRNLAELLMLQQQLASDNTVNQAAGLADLLANLNLQQSAQRFADGDMGNGQSAASVAAVQELFRQQALLSAGGLRQAGLGTRCPTLVQACVRACA
jgi:hypothetical protein